MKVLSAENKLELALMKPNFNVESVSIPQVKKKNI